MDARLDRVAHRAARTVAAHHRGYTTVPDLTQQAWVWLLAHPARVQQKLDGLGEPYPTLVSEVRAHLERVVAADRAALQPAVQREWSPVKLRAALPLFYAGSLPPPILSLMRVALTEKVGTRDAVLLREHYGMGLPWSVVAQRTGLSEPAVRTRSSRAVAAVCTRLNQPS